MVVGLGTGSTAYFAVERLGQLLASGELTDIVAIPTSVRTKEQAEELKIPLVTLDTHSKLDVAIDGAAYFAVERLGQLLASGELTDIVAIPTSVRTKEQAEELKIPLVTLDTHSRLDVAIDGADLVDPALNLVK